MSQIRLLSLSIAFATCYSVPGSSPKHQFIVFAEVGSNFKSGVEPQGATDHDLTPLRYSQSIVDLLDSRVFQCCFFLSSENQCCWAASILSCA